MMTCWAALRMLTTVNGRRTAPSGFGKAVDRLNAAVAKAAPEGVSPVAPWVLHDLRRTVATGLQRLGVRLEVTEAVLNHVSGSRAGIVGVYQRHGWAKEKRAALAAWAAHVAAADAGGTPAGVTEVISERAKRGVA